ncbi:hypothetical protein GDO81_021730 [Engystomops pustulosus]|uniref:Secreted protein n=1 Tax=Engystomops pustulosus TaxID=76066 RepID=A0AAV6YNW8_ENGPU|nr:hypothetical protein GDO81_021730 [Engystomops pustulosus]
MAAAASLSIVSFSSVASRRALSKSREACSASKEACCRALSASKEACCNFNCISCSAKVACVLAASAFARAMAAALLVVDAFEELARDLVLIEDTWLCDML